MLEHLLYGQLNPQNVMGQLGNPQLGGVGSFGIYPQTSGFGGINPTVGQFGTPVIDPVTAAYIQQQLAHQALINAGIVPSVSPWGQTGQIFGQQGSPYGQGSPLSHILGQQHYGQNLGQTSPWGQTPYGLGQMSPYSQIFGQSSPWGLGQLSPYTQMSPYTQNPLTQQQMSPYTQNPFTQQNPLLNQLQAALAAQYLTQQQFGRSPFGSSPFGQQFGQQSGAGWGSFGRGVSPFTQLSPFPQNAGFGTSPFQSFGYGGTQ